MQVIIFASVHKKGFLEACTELLTVLENRDIKMFIDENLHKFLVEQHAFLPKQYEIYYRNTAIPNCNLALSLGGDGTFLKTAKFVREYNIPVLGINLGNLGFLVDIKGDEITDAMNDIFDNGYQTQERSMLKIQLSNNAITEKDSYALNEIAMQKTDSVSVIKLHTSVNHEFLCTYKADALLVSTPTGTTAYALSVGASIMEPQNESIMLAPVAPHSLNQRPIIIPDAWVIDVEVECRGANFLIAVDGRSYIVDKDTKAKISKAKSTIKVAKRKGHTYFQTLREKFNWGL